MTNLLHIECVQLQTEFTGCYAAVLKRISTSEDSRADISNYKRDLEKTCESYMYKIINIHSIGIHCDYICRKPQSLSDSMIIVEGSHYTTIVGLVLLICYAILLSLLIHAAPAVSAIIV